MDTKKVIKKRLVVDLNPTTHKQIKLLAAELGISMAQLVDDSIANYVNYLKNNSINGWYKHFIRQWRWRRTKLPLLQQLG